MPRTWGALTLTRATQTTPSWATAAGLHYFLLTQRYSQWASGSALDGRFALQAGDILGEVAPHFLPFPATGWGFQTASSVAYGVANRTFPAAVPVLTISGSLPADNSAYVHAGGSGSMTYGADSREIRVLRPSFVRRIV
jgi:hypothetical protein